MINWPMLKFPPINLWTMPKLYALNDVRLRQTDYSVQDAEEQWKKSKQQG